jgi:hydroxyacylglutathione hydrolase
VKPFDLKDVNLHVLPAGLLQTNAYLLSAPELREAVLIDAPEGVWPEVERRLAAEGVKLTELWLTHGHWDHMQGAAEIVRATGAKVSAHRDDRELFETPERMREFIEQRLMIQLAPLEPVRVERWLEHGDRLEVLGTTCEVRHVPGHCPGNVLFYFSSAGRAFVGDSLFRGGAGRTDLPGGDFNVLERSIREQIYTLPPDTVVYPGHGPKTTVAHERAHNPYVSG